MQSISNGIQKNKTKIEQNSLQNILQDTNIDTLNKNIDLLNKSLINNYLSLKGGKLTGEVVSNSKIAAPIFEGELKGIAQTASSIELTTAENEAKLLVLNPEEGSEGKVQVVNNITIDPSTGTLKAEKIEANLFIGQSERANTIIVGENKNAKFDYTEAKNQPEYIWGTSSEEQTNIFKISELEVKKADSATVAEKLTEKTVGADNTPIYLVEGVATAGKELGTAAYMSKDDFATAGHSHQYLSLNGGTMTGTIKAKAEANTDDPEDAGLDMNNSNLAGLIAMYFGRPADGVNDGVNWPNNDKTFDTLFARNGNLYFVPKRKQNEDGEENIVLHSGNFETYAAPASHSHPYLSSLGGVMTGDLTLRPESGTIGGRIKMKPSSVMDTESGIAIEQYSSGLRIYGIPSADGTSVTGTGTPLIINPYNKTIIGGYEMTGSLKGKATEAESAERAGAAAKLDNALTIAGNGSDIDTFDGSVAKTINITPTAIGAAPVGHEHAEYLTEHQDISNKADKNGEYPNMKVGYATTAGSASASDVHDWAKAEEKPEYKWNEIKNTPTYYPPASHTHKYAASEIEGGAADEAYFLKNNGTLNFNKPGLTFYGSDGTNAKVTSGPSVNAIPSLDQQYNILRMNYGNAKGTYTDLAVSVTNGAGWYYRQVKEGSETTWRRLLDSSNYSTYCAAASHTHSYLPLGGGTMTGQIKKAGVSSSWIKGRDGALLSLNKINGYSAAVSYKTNNGSWETGVYDHETYKDKLIFNFTPDANYEADKNMSDYQVMFDSTGGIQATGTITGEYVYNAIYNDYAEFFPRGEETEPGDLIALDVNSGEEKYIKASVSNPIVVGTHTDEFAHLIGGERPQNGEDFVEYNLPKFIPVSLAGRVKVKFIGRAVKGAYAVPSEIAGVARMSKHPEGAIGIIVEADGRTDLRRLKILLKK